MKKTLIRLLSIVVITMLALIGFCYYKWPTDISFFDRIEQGLSNIIEDRNCTDENGNPCVAIEETVEEQNESKEVETGLPVVDSGHYTLPDDVGNWREEDEELTWNVESSFYYTNLELWISFNYPSTRQINEDAEMERDDETGFTDKKHLIILSAGTGLPVFMSLANKLNFPPRGGETRDMAAYIAENGEDWLRELCKTKSEYYQKCERKTNSYSVKYLKYYVYDWLEMGDEDENNKVWQVFYAIYNPYSEFYWILLSNVGFLSSISNKSFLITLPDYDEKKWSIVDNFDNSVLEDIIDSLQFIK